MSQEILKQSLFEFIYKTLEDELKVDFVELGGHKKFDKIEAGKLLSKAILKGRLLNDLRKLIIDAYISGELDLGYNDKLGDVYEQDFL